jgi:hypothetical protein
VETRAEQSLGSADALKGSHDAQRERDEPIGIDVGQLAFGLRPDELIRIELRRVPGKAVHFHAGMSFKKGPHVPTPMNLPPVGSEYSAEPHVVHGAAAGTGPSPVRYGARHHSFAPSLQPDRDPGQLSGIAASPDRSDREAVVQRSERESDVAPRRAASTHRSCSRSSQDAGAHHAV